MFNCWGCTALTLIPDTLTSLRYLNCFDCTALTSIPDTLISLRTLHCQGCTALTSIPDTLRSLRHLECRGCTWLPRGVGDLYFSENVKKLVTLQRWTRRHLRYWRLRRWFRSEVFARWFYSPDQVGGRISKHQLKHSINTISRKRVTVP